MKPLERITAFLKGDTPMRCEACGEGFSCGASLTGCWCTKVKLSDETRRDLKSRYSNCLCEGCLREREDPRRDATGAKD